MYILNPVNKPYLLNEIYESNFYKLFQLMPNLTQIQYSAAALLHGNPTLYLKLLNRSPYTLTIELTHCFNHKNEELFEPAMKIQVYLDAKSVEVLNKPKPNNHSTTMAIKPSAEDILNNKWNSNYFLEKWLNHCIASGYKFHPEKFKKQTARSGA